MFTFNCPGCHAPHSANEAFLGIRAKCLRCGAILIVGEKQTRPVAGKTAIAGGNGATTLELHSEAIPTNDDAAPSKSKPKSPDGPATAAARQSKDTDSSDEQERPERQEDEEEQDEEDPVEPEEPPVASRWKLWTALSAVALAAVAASIYFLVIVPSAPERIGPAKEIAKANANAAKSQPIDSKRNAEPPPSAEDENPENPAPAPKPKPAAKAAAPVKPALPAKPPIVATNSEPIRVSVHKLHRQHLADAAGAARQYDRKLLDLHGACARFTATPTGLRVAFATDKGAEPFVVTISPVTLEGLLRHIVPGQSVTFRGVYEATGKLHDADVIRTQTAGDEMYQGKQVEVMGYVGQVSLQEGEELASLRFEPDATDRMLGVECVFKKQQAGQAEGFKPGQFVMVRGQCGVQTFNLARLHNCQIVYDYNPRSDVARLSVGRILDDYEQDLRDAEADEPPDDFVSVSAAQLLEAYKDPAKGAKLYQRRGIEVDGTMESLDAFKSAVILEGGTDQGLKVRCMFSPANFRRLNPGPRMKIQGVCTGIDGKFVRLDNCEALQPAPKPERTGQRLDGEFHPFRQGASLVYESAYHAESAKRAALQQVLNFREDRILQFITTQSGQFKNKSGLAGGVVWNKKSTSNQPVLQHYRLHGGRVEISPAAAGAKGQPTGVWEPVLTVGAQVGDSWTWTSSGQKSVYTLVEFSDYETRTAAVIKKVTTEKVGESKNQAPSTETMLIYARGIGEVERKVYEVPGKGNKRLLTETRLVK